MLAVALAQCAGAGAQVVADDTLASTTELRDLSLEDLANVEVVSVARHPQKLWQAASAIQVISAEDIRRSGATNIPEALRLADNLDVAQKNSHDWAITARGFNTALANKLLVLIDGRTVYTPLFSGVFWDVQNYPLADVERIEVISGPGGTQWGANAVNGVINIITRNAQDTQGGYFEAAAGDHLQDSATARYGGRISANTFFRAYAQRADYASQSLTDGGSAHDAWNQARAGFRIDSTPSAHDTATLQGDYYRGDEDVPAGRVARVDGGNVLGRWRHATASGSDLSLQVYVDRTHLLDPVPAFAIGGSTLSPAGFLTDDLDTCDIDFQYRFPASDRQHILWGLGYRRTHDRVQNAPSIAFLPEVLDQNLYNAFIQDEIALGAVTVTAGTKLEHNDYTGFEIEPSVRALWNLSDRQVLWAAMSRAVRTPSRIDRDLSEPAPAAPLVVLEGSPRFVSETVVADEIGYRIEADPAFAASVSAFWNHYLHVRSTGLTPATLVPLFFENNVEGHTYGVEFGADYRASDNWRLHAGYDPIRDHLHVKPGAVDFNAALNEIADPHDRLSLRSALDLPHGIEFDAALRWTSPRDINAGAHIGVVPSYWDLNLRLAWQPSEHVEMSIAGQNLLYGRRPQYGFPDASQVAIERSVYGKITWRF